MLYDARNKAAIETLNPIVKKKVIALLVECEQNKIEILITEGFRSFEKQSQYYAIGRTTKLDSPKITNAKAGYSFHNYGLAIDFVPVKPDKTIDYGDKATYKKVADRAEKYGFIWGGNWKIKDLPHLEYTEGHDEEYFLLGGQLAQERDIVKPVNKTFPEWAVPLVNHVIKQGVTTDLNTKVSELPLYHLLAIIAKANLQNFK